MKGIIVASFGSTYRDAYNRSVGRLYERIKNSYKDYYVLEAYSSEMVRKRIKNRDGLHVFNIIEALKDMEDKNIKDIYVLAAYVIEGHEYSKIIKMAEDYNFNKRLNIKFSKGLFSVDEDINNVASFFEEVKRDEADALVLMGHGSFHDEDIKYSQLQKHFDTNGKNILIGTVEGSVVLDDVISSLKNTDNRRVDLMPLMLVAGDHVSNDMASDEDDSWKTLISNEGFLVEPITKGMLEYKDIENIFCDKLREIIWN